LASYGLEWIQPPVMFAHPFDDGNAALAYRSLDRTAEALGADRDAYRKLLAPVVENWPRLERSVLGPPAWPRHPVSLARFGSHALRPAEGLARSFFEEEPARALIGGVAAHAI